MKPQPKTRPITEAFMGGSENQMRGTTELYFPEGYKDIQCVVSGYRVEVENMCDLTVKVSFALQGKEKTLTELYSEEDWKLQSTEDLYEHDKNAFQGIQNAAPLFAMMLNKYLRVLSAELKVERQEAGVVVDPTPDILILPPSYPPLTGDLPKDAYHIYYDRKSAGFYGEIVLGKTYDLTVKLQSLGGVFEHAPVFPYGGVVMNNIEVLSAGDLEVGPVVLLKVKPEIKKNFPAWLEAGFAHLLDLTPRRRRPTHLKPAHPFRGKDPLFNPLTDLGIKVTKPSDIPNDVVLAPKEVKNFRITDYGTLSFAPPLIIPIEKDFDIVVKTIQRPIPSRIYEQMQSLPYYEDVLVAYDIFNFGKKKLRLRVQTEISNFTEKEAHTYFVPALNNGNNQKARAQITHCPRLKRGVLQTIVNQEPAVLLCKVINEDTKDTLYEQTFNIDLLPNDQMIWELRDVKSLQKYRLHDFIGAWVQPKDAQGLMDKTRTDAARLHPRQALGTGGANPKDLVYIKGQVRAIYEHLQKEGFRYVNQAFTSSPLAKSQRVVLPDQVLQNKSGNCIDLTVLFASLLEGLGIYSLILITPTHAFVGWGDLRSKDNAIFLETTVIASQSFDEALRIGEKNFKDNFLFIGGDFFMGNSFTFYSKGAAVVDLHQLRYPHLHPERERY
jgi:hypothetical protein